MQNLTQIKGDASFRKFFRKRKKGHNSILVFAKREKLKNLLIYDAINKILKKNKILAPNLYKENYRKNFIEIQDFGDETIFKILNKKRIDKLSYFKKIILLLIKIQSIKNRKIKNFKDKNYIIPKYDKKILIKEANLFCDWYVKGKLLKIKKKKFTKEFKKIITRLSNSLKLENDTFVHRDFHISNLMLVNKRIGLIDSQDALIGNRAYDLASLIDDVRFRTPESLKNKIFDFYIKKQKNLNLKKFKNDFEILSVLRNLKIIGIFMRLYIRDHKKKYLKLIPYAWEMINHRIKDQNEFNNLMLLLKNNFPKFIR